MKLFSANTKRFTSVRLSKINQGKKNQWLQSAVGNQRRIAQNRQNGRQLLDYAPITSILMVNDADKTCNSQHHTPNQSTSTFV